MEKRALAPRDTDLALCSFSSSIHSLWCCLLYMRTFLAPGRQTPRHGKPDRHAPCPQTLYCVIRKREIKQRNRQIMVTLSEELDRTSRALLGLLKHDAGFRTLALLIIRWESSWTLLCLSLLICKMWGLGLSHVRNSGFKLCYIRITWRNLKNPSPQIVPIPTQSGSLGMGPRH